jgi:hypothetical protein
VSPSTDGCSRARRLWRPLVAMLRSPPVFAGCQCVLNTVLTRPLGNCFSCPIN